MKIMSNYKQKRWKIMALIVPIATDNEDTDQIHTNALTDQGLLLDLYPRGLFLFPEQDLRQGPRSLQPKQMSVGDA